MSRNSVAIVLFSLLAGGAVGIVYEDARQQGAVIDGVARTGVDVSPEAGTGEVALTSRADVMRPGAGDEADIAVSASAARAVRRARVARRQDDRPARVNFPPAAARGYMRVSRREAGDGGRGVAGHMAGGVKKTGAVISKPFVKVGGLFHD